MIDRKRLAHPIFDENLDCAMDYKFNLISLINDLIANVPGYYCGYRIRQKSITRSNKRVKQLINHARIIIESALSQEELNTDDKKVLMRSYALGLCRIANEPRDIYRSIIMNYGETGKSLNDILVI